MDSSVIEKIREAGLNVGVLNDDKIEVWPRDRITDEIRALIRAHKPQLLALLKRDQTIRPHGLSKKLLLASMELDAEILAADILRGFRLKRAPEPEPQIAPTQVEPPPPPRPPETKHIDADWHAAAEAYHQHHFSCTACKSAGQGRGERCNTGSALWAIYQTNLEGQKA